MRLRVALVSPTYFAPDSAVGGGERFALELARALSNLVDVKLVSFGHAKRRVEAAPSLTLKIHKAKYLRGNVVNPLNLTFLGDLLGVDVVHFLQFETITSNLGVVLAKMAGRKVHATDLGGGGRNLSSALRLGDRVDSFLLVSRFSASTLSRCHARKEIIYGGVDLGRFENLNRRRSFVLYVGRLKPHKGVDVLINAMPAGVRLMVRGPAGDEKYLGLLRGLSLGKDVIIDLNVTKSGTLEGDRQLAEYYSSAFVTVLPSVHTDVYRNYQPKPELLGLAVLESYACRTPAIVTNVGGLPEVVLDGETGFIVEPNDAAALREKIEYFVHNPEESERMGANGRRLVEEKFTWDRVARRCLEAYGKS